MIAMKRMEICKECEHFDETGEYCLMPGTQPCCKLCGCCLEYKVHCMSVSCDINKWQSVNIKQNEHNIS